MLRISTSNIMRAALFVTLIACPSFSRASVVSPTRVYAQETEKSNIFARCWTYETAIDLSIQAESDSSNLYFIDVERRLIALDINAGAILWSTELGGSVVSGLLVTPDSIVLATSSDANRNETVLRSVSKQTGITTWLSKFSNAATVTIGVINGSIVSVAQSGAVTSFRANTGDRLWEKIVDRKFTTAPFFAGSSFLIGSDRKEVLMIAGATGESSVVGKTEGTPAVIFSDPSGHLLTGDDRGNLVFASIEGKRIWKFRNGARLSALSIYDSEFVVSSNDNFVYKITRSGNVEWKRRLSSRIVGRPLVLGDVAIFATVGDGNVYTIDLKSGKIVNRFETGQDTTAQASIAGKGFAILTEDGVTLYTSGGCPINKKTVP